MLGNAEYLKAKKVAKKVQEAYFYNPEFRDFIKEIRIGVCHENYCIRMELVEALPENLRIADHYDDIKIIKIYKTCQTT